MTQQALDALKTARGIAFRNGQGPAGPHPEPLLWRRPHHRHGPRRGREPQDALRVRARLEQNYRNWTTRAATSAPSRSRIGRSMHRGAAGGKFLLDMMREIPLLQFPKSNRLAVGLGGGHSGFTVCALHFLTVSDPAQHVYVDTPAPEGPTLPGPPVSSGRAGARRSSR